ncbi:hypothetical protein C448_02913 [Halococcus morrhuae DSM 1307]|uniref:Phospholipase D-like domain-containing protein n=1 Tax=Halococcus morrhuae DSM 1307 TaxID=931277 RepID=M0MWG5_HALMO|nr:phospholipase D-like domain-containing protein [Halococcus morrhuae]EMA48785.1 hypothetical protein C448_02913 [Halococcus morrhuae DSM 1307]
MPEIVHHTDESAAGGVSPFDAAIREIVADEEVLFASPYITLDYLDGVLDDTASWRLLTDMEAWLDNYRRSERETIREFVARHPERIRDVRNLHAKAVIGETGALVGSANLTRTGLGRRDELGVRFDDPERIVELREWFEGLWTENSPAKLDAIDERIQTSSSIPSSASASSATSIPSESRRVSATIAKSSPEKRTGDGYDRLINRLTKAPCREWAAEHLELMRELIEISGLDDEDKQLVTSIPSSGTEIRLIIGNRVVFGFVGKTGNWTRFIIPDDYENIGELLQSVPRNYDFKGESAPHLPAVTDGLHRARQTLFRKAWIEATLNEIGRYETSPYRDRSHEPAVYRAAVDHDYRERILDEAFDR